jgi:hypothetical protein
MSWIGKKQWYISSGKGELSLMLDNVLGLGVWNEERTSDFTQPASVF